MPRSVGEPQHFLDPVQAARGGEAAIEQRLLDAAVEIRRHRRHAHAPGGNGKAGWPVATLRGDRKIVTAEQPRSQGKRLRRRWLRLKGNDAVEIGIAFENAGGIGEYQRVDGGIRPRAPQAADQRRAQQHIAQAAQGDHQDARLLRQRDTVGVHGGAPACLSAARFFNAMPPATPTPST